MPTGDLVFNSLSKRRDHLWVSDDDLPEGLCQSPKKYSKEKVTDLYAGQLISEYTLYKDPLKH